MFRPIKQRLFSGLVRAQGALAFTAILQDYGLYFMRSGSKNGLIVKIGAL